MTTQIELLRTRRFLPLFITQFLGAFNDNVFKNALVILITYHAIYLAGLNSQILVTLAAGIFILPFFLFSATAGQLADKYEKSRLIMFVKLFEIIIMIIAAIGFYFNYIPLLLFTLFLLGIQATFFGPIKYAILPDHLQENELIAGNGLIEAGTFLSILIGTILGGILILYPFGAYIISFVILLIAVAGFISSLYIPKTVHQNPHLHINYHFFKETINIIKDSRKQGEIFLSILGISWFWLIGAIFLAEMPVFTNNELQANASVVTLFFTLFSIGLAIGSLLCNRLLKGKVQATYVPLGALGMTVFMIDLYFAAKHAGTISLTDLQNFFPFIFSLNHLRIMFDFTLIAICGGLYTVPLYAILQQKSSEAHRARVIASNNIMNAFFMVIAALVTIILFKLGLRVSQIFLLVAIVNAMVTIYICKLLPDALVKSFLHWLFKSIYRVDVVGLENYYAAGDRVLIIANHTSFLDAALLATFLPEKLTYAVDTFTAKKWWIKLFLKLVNTYSIDPTNPMAIKSLIELMKKDVKCVIFPEGRLTVTGALMKVYEGPGLIADKSGAKILPIRIQGAQFTLFSRLRGKVPIRFAPKITLTIFPARSLDVSSEIKGRSRRQKIGYWLYDLMTDIVFESSDYQKTLFQSLLDANKLYGRHYPILEDIERAPLHYQQFINRCFILGAQIAKQTESKEHVGILLPNMISTALTFFAMQAYSRIPAMLNYSTGSKNVVSACQTAEIKTVYTSRKFVRLAKLNDMIRELEAVQVNVIYLEDVRREITFFTKLKGMIYGQFPQTAYHLINRCKKTSPSFFDINQTAVVLFTSGSEGTPKGVLLSHQNIQANRFQLSARIDFTASDKILNALPVFHSFGLTAGMLLPMLSGIKVFFYPSPLHFRIVPEVSYDTNATILFGTDTFLNGYWKYAHAYDFYSIRYVFAGAEKLRNETRARWAEKFGLRIFEGYGVSETSPVLAMNTPMQYKPHTVGRLLPGIQYQVKPVPGILEGGELSVSGPNIMKGYLLADQPGKIVPPKKGWHETGDIVSIDELGYVTILGRIKRFAKIAGEMVSLGMIEQQINLLWPTYQNAVISIPDEKKGEQLVLITTNQEATREAVVSFAKANQLGEICIPKKILIQKILPLLGSGKIDYVQLKQFVIQTFARYTSQNFGESTS